MMQWKPSPAEPARLELALENTKQYTDEHSYVNYSSSDAAYSLM